MDVRRVRECYYRACVVRCVLTRAIDGVPRFWDQLLATLVDKDIRGNRETHPEGVTYTSPVGRRPRVKFSFFSGILKGVLQKGLIEIARVAIASQDTKHKTQCISALIIKAVADPKHRTCKLREEISRGAHCGRAYSGRSG